MAFQRWLVVLACLPLGVLATRLRDSFFEALGSFASPEDAAPMVPPNHEIHGQDMHVRIGPSQHFVYCVQVQQPVACDVDAAKPGKRLNKDDNKTQSIDVVVAPDGYQVCAQRTAFQKFAGGWDMHLAVKCRLDFQLVHVGPSHIIEKCISVDTPVICSSTAAAKGFRANGDHQEFGDQFQIRASNGGKQVCLTRTDDPCTNLPEGKYCWAMDLQMRCKKGVPKTVPMKVKLEYVPSQLGQEVVMVGNFPDLGEWSPEAGVTMTGQSPITWQAEFDVTLAEGGRTFMLYKFVKDTGDQGDSGDRFNWELGQNRFIDIPPSVTRIEVVAAKFGEPKKGAWVDFPGMGTDQAAAAGPPPLERVGEAAPAHVPQAGGPAPEAPLLPDPTCKKCPTARPSQKIYTEQDFHPWMTQSELLNELGKGAFGKVLLLQFDCLGKSLAAMKKIKLLDASGIKIRAIRKGAEFAVQKIAGKANPLVVAVLQTAARLNVEYVLLEYMPGNELTPMIDNRFNRKGFAHVDGGRLLQVIYGQMVRAIMRVHENGVVHRDLKPPNFLVNKEECMMVDTADEWTGKHCSVKVTDFGMACQPGFDTEWPCDADPKGTLYYVGPEVFGPDSGKPANYPTDVWSMGIIFYEMLFAKHPWSEFTIVDDGVKFTGENRRHIMNLKYLFRNEDFGRFHTFPSRREDPGAHALEILKMTLKRNHEGSPRWTMADVWNSAYLRPFHKAILEQEKLEMTSSARSLPKCVVPEDYTEEDMRKALAYKGECFDCRADSPAKPDA